jgi:hypothetical protein
MHFEILTAAATAAVTAGSAAAALAGDSLTIKNGASGKDIDIISMWQTNQTAGFGQIAFPSGHDTTRGYRAGVSIGINPAMLPLGQSMKVQPQELLAVTLAGTAVAGDVENISMLIRYKDLPGTNQRLIDWNELMRRISDYTTIETSVASTAGPSYGTELAITTGSDLLKANRDYAVLGMSSRTQVHSMNLRGPDLGNLRIGMPGILRQEYSSQFFTMLSRAHGEPLIPIINSGNKNQTFVGIATDENAGTFVTTLYLALLK